MYNFEKLSSFEKKNLHHKKINSFNSNKTRKESIKRKESSTKIQINKIKKYIVGNTLLISNSMLIQFTILSVLFYKFNNRIIELGYSSIKLKTNKTGEIKILSDNFNNTPNEVWIMT